MNADQIQEIGESIFLAALNGGLLSGFVFRHDDSPLKAKADMVSVKAGPPVPQMEGPRCYRVEVEINLKSKTATRNAALHGEALRRVTDFTILHNAALSAGLLAKDDLVILDEEISGDRAETKSTRQRSISVPILLRIN